MLTMMSSFRRSKMSARVPPTIESRSSGTSWAKMMRLTNTGEPVIL